MLPDRHGTVAVATSRCHGYRLGCVPRWPSSFLQPHRRRTHETRTDLPHAAHRSCAAGAGARARRRSHARSERQPEVAGRGRAQRALARARGGDPGPGGDAAGESRVTREVLRVQRRQAEPGAAPAGLQCRSPQDRARQEHLPPAQRPARRRSELRLRPRLPLPGPRVRRRRPGLHHPNQPRCRRRASGDAHGDQGRDGQVAACVRRLRVVPVGPAPAVHLRRRQRGRSVAGDAGRPVEGGGHLGRAGPRRLRGHPAGFGRQPVDRRGRRRRDGRRQQPRTAAEQLRVPLQAVQPQGPARRRRQATGAGRVFGTASGRGPPVQ